MLDGKVEGDKVSFGELLKFEGMEIKITYTGTIVSADEISSRATSAILRPRSWWRSG